MLLERRTYSPPVSLFLGYADEDRDIQKKLQAHFANLRNRKLVNDWGHFDMLSGEHRDQEIEDHFNDAKIILLLISVHFMNSEYCSRITARALERDQKGEATVIPIQLGYVDTAGAPFSYLEMLPKGEKPITSWDDHDEACDHIIHELRKVIDDVLGWNALQKEMHRRDYPELDDGVPCPYLGVRPYSEDDAHLFFGRETYTNDLMYALSRDPRLLLLLGPIGSGKTSVIQAGVIPLLRKGSPIIPRSFKWEILTFVPDERPLGHLFSLMGVQDTKDLAEGVKHWKQQHPSSERLVIVLDQFEELFRLASPEEQKYFITQLSALIIHDLATIIIAMSDAYYDELATHVHFMNTAEQYISNIPPLQAEEITNVIRKPAQLVRVHFEGQLAEKITDDTIRSTQEPQERRKSRHSSILPLLSVCLEQLWERQQDHFMWMEDYEAIGQVMGALTTSATHAFHALNEKQQQLARRIFVDLVTLGDESEGRPDCRRQRGLTQLYYRDDEKHDVQDVVEKLAQAHLLETQLDEQRELKVTIIHESLLREWSLLHDWLREDHLFLLWYREFELYLQKWSDNTGTGNQRDLSSLLRGRMLVEALHWLEEKSDRFSSQAQAFIHASNTQRQQEELQERELQTTQERQRTAQAKHLATKALLMQEQEPHLLRKSLLIATEALRRHHCVEADQALRQAITLLPRIHSRTRMTTAGQTILFSGNGQSLATTGLHGVSWQTNVGSLDEVTEPAAIGKTSAIALSYDGEYLLAGVITGVTWLIHTLTGNKVAMIKQDVPICCLALSQRPPYIAAIGYHNGTVEIYQFSNIEEPGRRLPESDLRQHTRLFSTFQHDQAISSLSFSHTDRYLVSGGRDSIVRIWSRDKDAVLDIYHFQSPICSTLLSPDDTFIAIRCEDGKAFVWQWEQHARTLWKRKRTLVKKIPQAEIIQDIAFGPGGNSLITTTVDGFVRIWILGDIIEEMKLVPHNSPVSSLCYHPGKDWLALACKDKTVKIYSIVDGRLQYTIPHTTPITSIAFNLQKPYLATADTHGYVWVWQLMDGNQPRRFCHAGKIAHLYFDPDNPEYMLHLTLEFPTGIRIYSLSLDAVATNNTIHGYEQLPNQEITAIKRQSALPQATINMRAFSSDGRYIADVTGDGSIKVKATNSKIYTYTLPTRSDIRMLAFSRNGEYLAYINNQDQVLLWTWREKKNMPTILFQVENIRELAFSKDDEYVLVANNTNKVFIWQWKTQAKEPYHVLRHEESICTRALYPDTRYLLTVNNDASARVWDMTTGVLVHHLHHTDDILAATFDSEGKYLATASADHTVGIWNVSTGEQLAHLSHDGKVYAIAFSHDRKYLATACDDAIVRIWQWRPHDLEREAKLRLASNLTYEEWQEYIGNDPHQETFDDLGWRELPFEDPFDDEETHSATKIPYSKE